MMDGLIQTATQMAHDESQRGIAQYGPAASAHEGYALIKEELEEAQNEFRRVEQRLEGLWASIKGNDVSVYPHYLNQIRQNAILAACEMIQVAAMAEKTLGIAQNIK